MGLESRDYNAFARSLSERFSIRAVGRDKATARICGARPADQILAGFLTPGGHHDPDDDVDGLATDLPHDSAYEQTAMGLEWHSPVGTESIDGELRVTVDFNVFVRRLPTFSELEGHLRWRRPRNAPGDVAEQSELPQVWTRESLGPFDVQVSAARLQRERLVQLALGDRAADAWRNVEPDLLYPGRTGLRLTRSDVRTPADYSAWIERQARVPSDRPPVEWRPQIDVRVICSPVSPTKQRIALRFVNRSVSPAAAVLPFVDPNLYAVNLRCSVPAPLHLHSEFQDLPDSFRFDRRMPAVGINAHVEAHTADENVVLTAHAIAKMEAARLVPREIADASPRFVELAAAPHAVLERIRNDMMRYHSEEWAAKISTLAGEEQVEAKHAQQEFYLEIERFERGIALINDPRYPAVGRAFSLMNRAMGHVGEARNYTSWRLFQIAFIVSQLPALAAREHEELRRSGDDDVDILWFAAGGGKTEAFLGLILWQAFFDRLRGKTLGVSALVRFPLRLLSFQQFARLGRALAAAELIRTSERLGGARFSIGFFVGSQVTPNSIDNDRHQRFQRSGVSQDLRRVSKCPFCGAGVQLRYEASLRLVEHWCASESCPGGKQRLPIYIVDQDVYRYLPTLLVSTVDKLAQLGQNQRFANILGRISAVCPIHGATFDGIDSSVCAAAEAHRRGARDAQCRGRAVLYGPFRDVAPALLVQDEMHLLSEDLGAFDAHYETAAAQMAISLGMKPWKIIGATATIEDYAQHARQLYLKRARRFPGPGPGADESFYYRRDEERIGRIFLGVLGVGRKHTPIVSRALTILYLELQEFRTLARSDPAAARAMYGLRELGQRELQELVFLYELPLTYVLTRKGSDQVAEAIESRVKKELEQVAPDHGNLLIRTFNSGVDVADMMKAMDEIEADRFDGDPTTRIRGLVTTNIIGHGVDVDRFNVMVFAGFTRLVAEYIQASARVGRTFPGISILAITPQSERDRSIFDRFAKFHEYLDRLVDPSAVNRWSVAALDRTLPGIIAGYLMAVAAKALDQGISSVEDVQDALGRAGAEALNEDALVEWLTAAYGTEHAPSPLYLEKLRSLARNKRALVVNAPPSRGGKPRWLNTHLGSMRSLRDVDEPAEILVGQKQHVAALKGLLRG